MDRKILKEELKRIEDLLVLKNNKYGDSFYKSLNKNSSKALTVRLEDKINRMENLFEACDLGTEDESVIDTITDIAGYCILYLTYVKEKELNKNKSFFGYDINKL